MIPATVVKFYVKLHHTDKKTFLRSLNCMFRAETVAQLKTKIEHTRMDDEDFAVLCYMCILSHHCKDIYFTRTIATGLQSWELPPRGETEEILFKIREHKHILSDKTQYALPLPSVINNLIYEYIPTHFVEFFAALDQTEQDELVAALYGPKIMGNLAELRKPRRIIS